MKPLSRRAVLRGAGGVAVSLPYLEAMVTGRALAQAARPPRRIVFVLTPGGYVLSRWKCTITGTEARTFPLSPVLSEFAAVRDSALFIEGVPLTSAEDARTCAAGHPQGNSAVFTGSFAGPGSQYGGNTSCTVGPPQSESVDQALALQLGQATRFPAVYAGAFPKGNVVANRVFYGRNQTFMSPQSNPAELFRTLFSDFNPPDPRKALEERQFVLGSASDQYKALRCQLGGADRQRLDQHLDELTRLSGRLALSSSGNACRVPAQPTGLDLANFSNLPAVTTAHLDVLAMALACDLTRIVGFYIHAPDMDGQGIYSWLGHDLIWHQITHLEGTTPEDRIEQTNRWYAKQVLYLANKLKGMVEADGSTVFDNTAIVWVSEVAQGWSHQVSDMPWTILGKGQGYFDTGKYIRFPNTSDVRHNRLLVHFLNYMGVPASAFGHPDYQGAPLSGIAS